MLCQQGIPEIFGLIRFQSVKFAIDADSNFQNFLKQPFSEAKEFQPHFNSLPYLEGNRV